MEKVMFREAERYTEGIYDCFSIEENGVRSISQAECYSFINSLGVKCYGKDDKGYIIYGK